MIPFFIKHIELLRWIARILSSLVGICYLYQIIYLFAPWMQRFAARIRNRVRHGKPPAPAMVHTDAAGAPSPLRIGTGEGYRVGILIAARNEEKVLPYLLDSIRAQDYPGSIRTFVVADNCTDRTAEAAEAHGARVYRRENRKQVGKGFALRYLLEQITEDGSFSDINIFLIFDADNLLRPDYVSEITRTFALGYEAVCGYRNSKNALSNWISAGYAVWYMHESIHMNRSRALLGANCAVNGTGFGFTRALLERLGGWRFFTLTEDLEFNTWCASHGVRIGYCHTAMLYDEQPTSFRQSWRQRTRWVQGGIQVSFKYAADLFRGLFSRRTRYSCFETITLSIWGYGSSALVSVFALLPALLAGTLPDILRALILPILGMCAFLTVISALTVASEWDNLGGSAGRRLAAVFTFPLFMLTYIPIGVCAFFTRFNWKPIEHNVAVSINDVR